MADVVDFQGGKRAVTISEGRGQDFQSIASISGVGNGLPLPHASLLRAFCKASADATLLTHRKAFGKMETVAWLSELLRQERARDE